MFRSRDGYWFAGVRGDLVSFCSGIVFAADGAVLTSESTLRFRRREEVAESLAAAGFALDDVRSQRSWQRVISASAALPVL